MPIPGITPSSATPVAPRPVTPPPSEDAVHNASVTLSTAATVPVNTATTPAESASAPPLPLSYIEQKELAYFATINQALHGVLEEAGLVTSSARRLELGLQLLYIVSECSIGTQTLADFRRDNPAAAQRGDALLGRLPQSGDPLFGVGSRAYETLLTTACFPDEPQATSLRTYSAYFLTQATRPPAPAP